MHSPSSEAGVQYKDVLSKRVPREIVLIIDPTRQGVAGRNPSSTVTNERCVMCSRYEAPTPERFQEEFGVEFDAQEKLELWPGYAGPFLQASQCRPVR